MPVLLGLSPQDLGSIQGTVITPHPQGVYLSLTDKSLLKDLWARFYPHWRISVQNPANSLTRMLTANNLTLALAESCTGGAIADLLTNEPGASQYMQGGVVVYTVGAKTKLLGIPNSALPPGGVGSELTSVMAKNIRSILKADIGVGITGALGPQSPAMNIRVGEVYIAVNGMGNFHVSKFNFSGDRQTIKAAAVEAALNFVLAFRARW